MTHPGVTLMVIVGVSLGALLYYIFSDNNSEGHHQYGNRGGGHDQSSGEPSNSWNASQNERTRRRKRVSCAGIGKSSCTICLMELVEKECIQIFPCEHEFHKICITKWREQGPSETRNTCPNCREGIYESAMCN